MVVNTRKNPRRDQEFEESRLCSESETSMAGSLPMNSQSQNIPSAQQGQNGLGRTTAIDANQVLVEDVTDVSGGPVLRPNPATSLEIQQIIRAMEIANQLHDQRMQEVTQTLQTFATQNAQINERFDRWLGQQNGQNGNQVGPNGVPAAGPQVDAQPNIVGANPPQPNLPAGGNPVPAINVPPMGNNPYVAANQFQGFQPYNQFRPQANQGAGVNFAGPHINQFAGVGGWNNGS